MMINPPHFVEILPHRAVTAAPMVIFLHGRGGDEHQGGDVLPLAFPYARLRCYRAPFAEGDGYAWFRNRQIGVADPESLTASLIEVERWFAALPMSDHIWLCGFSNGAAMAASLLLNQPHRYRGLIVIGGCIAVPVATLPAACLDTKPVLFCRGRDDDVIPAAKFFETATFFAAKSESFRQIIYHGGHELTPDLMSQIAAWFGDVAVSEL